jgi:hypothetical protein
MSLKLKNPPQRFAAPCRQQAANGAAFFTISYLEHGKQWHEQHDFDLVSPTVLVFLATGTAVGIIMTAALTVDVEQAVSPPARSWGRRTK